MLIKKNEMFNQLKNIFLKKIFKTLKEILFPNICAIIMIDF